MTSGILCFKLYNFNLIIIWICYNLKICDCRWEIMNKQLFNVTIAAVKDNMCSIARALTFSNTVAVSHAITSVMERSLTAQAKPLQIQTGLWCTHAMVHYFFYTLQNDGKNVTDMFVKNMYIVIVIFGLQKGFIYLELRS